MSKKNIARTAIEGGRGNRNKWERRYSNQNERVNVRNLIASVKNDIEKLEEQAMPQRSTVHPEFRDKLNPVYRWLDSHVGESWDDIRSLLTSQFDTRTTAGRHVLHDHVLGEILFPGNILSRYYSYYKYFVDDAGLLQKKQKDNNRHRILSREPVSSRRKLRILDWIGIRKLGWIGAKLYWFEATSSKEKVVVTWGRRECHWYDKSYYHVDGDRLYYMVERRCPTYDELGNRKGFTIEHYRLGVPNYRQAKEFSAADYEFFNSLPDWMRDSLAKTSPLIKPEKGYLY